MKPPKLAGILFLVVAYATLLRAQDSGHNFPPYMRLSTRQGYPEQTDIIAHKVVSRGIHAQCIKVEHHPRSDDDGAACLVKLQDGEKHVVKFGKTMEIPTDGEIFLECPGDKPTACTIGLY